MAWGVVMAEGAAVTEGALAIGSEGVVTAGAVAIGKDGDVV